MSKQPDATYDPDRRVRELTDELELVRSELGRLEAALDAARRFGAEQAALATQRLSEVSALRSTKTFVYTAPLRRLYGKFRGLAGRVRRTWRDPQP
jgi:hypothetical protein